MNLHKNGSKNRLYDELLADGEVQRVSLDKVKRDDRQPRSLAEVMLAAKDLAPSIKTHGVVQMPVYWAKPDGHFLIIVGECRTEGAKLAGLHDIAAVIKTFDDSKEAAKQIAEIRYAENDPKTRKNLVPLDEAKFWSDYIAEHYTDDKGKSNVKKAAEYLGENASKISQFLGIHRASNKVKTFIKKYDIRDYQLAYIMARMDKHPGLVDEFVKKLNSADIKGGIQKLANQMLKTAANEDAQASHEAATLIDDTSQSQGTTVAPQTAQQAQKQRENDNIAATAEDKLKEELLKQERQNPVADTGEKDQERDTAVKDDEEAIVNDLAEPESPAPEVPTSTGNVRLNMSKNTIVLTTVANQPATLNTDNVKALVNALNKWIEENSRVS